MPPLRATVLTCAIAAATCVASADARDLRPGESFSQDPSLIGRPSQDAPDACAALPLEWRLRCYGGPAHSVYEIGAPYSHVPDQQEPNAPESRPAWLPERQPAGTPSDTPSYTPSDTPSS